MTMLDNLLPEIFPIVAAHLPLRAAPPTLLALALTNHRISEVVRPLVSSRIILKNEAAATRVLHRVLDDAPFGRGVHELHIASELSEETRKAEIPCDVVGLLERAISEGRLPFVYALGLHLLGQWHYYNQGNLWHDASWHEVRLQRAVWTNIKSQHCPRLRSVAFSGFLDNHHEPWLADSGILDIPVSLRWTLK